MARRTAARARALRSQLVAVLGRIAQEEARLQIVAHFGLAGRAAIAKQSDLSGELNEQLLAVLTAFGMRQFEDAAAESAGEARATFTMRPFARERFLEEKEIKIVEIQESIRRTMVDVTRREILASERESPRPPVGDVARRIRLGLTETIGIEQYRAERIARTETQAAMQAGRREGFLVSGVRQVRWVPIRDGRGRHDHLRGEVRGLNEPFKFEAHVRRRGVLVGTGRMVTLRYPADPLGPADQIIQCRCTLVAHRG